MSIRKLWLKRRRKYEVSGGKNSFAYSQWQKRYLRRSYEIESRMTGTKVDIVVPVYNAEKSLPAFFASVQKTNIQFRLILIDDASDDMNTQKMLQQYAHTHENVDLIRNSQNIGIVGSINRGLAMARNHVVLLSANVELPQNWLERLISPIIKDPTIASATPFTNNGSLCGFPLSGKNNSVFNHIPVDQIDQLFREIRSIYTTIPAGAMFCMAMSQKAIREVGLLDQKTFGKGFGEDTDWCRRAVAVGFRNVMVENLYVCHNTGNSYYAVDRRKRMQVNREKLLAKHPGLTEIMQNFTEEDPLGPIRSYVLCRLTSALSAKRYMIFHSELEGGANIYIQRYAEQRRNEKAVTVIILYCREKQNYLVEYQWSKYKASLEMDNLDEVFEFCDKMELNQLIVNHLVTYPNVREHLLKIREYAETNGIRLMVMVHDYYLLCPSMYLMNDRDEYCGAHSPSQCDQCLKNQQGYSLQDFASVREWRSAWRTFLLSSQEVRVFSQDSARLVKKAYGGLDQIQILPVQHTVLTKVKKEFKTTDTLNIGLMGTLTDFKGGKLVAQLAQLVNDQKLPIRFVLCGSTQEKINSKVFLQTGQYKTENLPSLIYQHDIDLFFISSIYPETFSYTTQEAMEMEMPVACLPLGAPAERVARYENGLVLAHTDAQAVLQQLMEFGDRMRKPYKDADKALLVFERGSDDSRYRIEHLSEQLHSLGIASTRMRLEDVSLSQVRKYKWLILHGCTASKKIHKLIAAANDGGASIWYSVDQLVFDEKILQNSLVSKQAGYRELVMRCNGIRECMAECDGILVPTEALKKVVEEHFKGKSVYVQRDVVNYSMLAISNRADSHRRIRYDSVILGFLGDKDAYSAEFSAIEPIILEILYEYPQVKLRIGGAPEISKELESVGGRVKRWNEKNWQERPTLYTKIDIHLMPIPKDAFYTSRSERKWLEASLLKIPTIASKCEEMTKVIRDGETGILCGSKEEWKKKLVQLIEDAQYRKQLGLNAQEEVMHKHTTADLEREVKEIFM